MSRRSIGRTQADPHGCRPSDPANVPNYDADAIIGATVSEIMPQKSPSFVPATIEGSAGLPWHDGSAIACHLA
jgi:hypothetical protein